MQRKFQDLLHKYKLDLFHAQHDKKSVDEISSEVLHFTEEALAQKLSFHFHRLPDASRAEIVNMINNYVREAILPPVVERITKRQVLLEKRVLVMESLLTQILDTLGNEPAGAAR
ncbi:MAG: hypothetical protein JNK02_15470 [Planctomycetes bacterium]|nr:hypothetical protein [Planctomycetota bacterium]